MDKAARKRNVYMDVLRALSCFFVIGGHISAYNWNDTSVLTYKYHVLNICDNISALGVPLFIMLSGALHLNAEYNLTFKTLFQKKIFRMLVTYYFWLLFYNIFNFVQMGYAWDFANIKFYIIGRLIRGQGIYHLWFIPKLLFMYLITPFIKESMKSEKITRYAVLFFGIVVVGIPTIFTFDFPGKDWILLNYDMNKFFEVTSTFCYLGFYIAGHYVNSFAKPLTKVTRPLAYLTVLLSTGTAIVLGVVKTAHYGIADTTYMTPLYIFLYISGIACFMLFKDWCRNLEDKGTPKWADAIGKLSFGVYLVHPIFIKFFPALGISMLSPNPILMVPVMILVVFVLSAALSWVLGKIPFLNKWIV